MQNPISNDQQSDDLSAQRYFEELPSRILRKLLSEILSL